MNRDSSSSALPSLFIIVMSCAPLDMEADHRRSSCWPPTILETDAETTLPLMIFCRACWMVCWALTRWASVPAA